MQIIPFYRNKIDGDIYVLTHEGFFFVDSNMIDHYFEDSITRFLGSKEKLSIEYISSYPEIEKYGNYNPNLPSNIDSFTINNPFIKKCNISEAFKFSKKISLKNLCKEFLLCAKRNDCKLNILQNDNLNFIVSFLLKDYMLYSLK